MTILDPPPTDRRIDPRAPWLIAGATIDDMLAGPMPATVLGPGRKQQTPATVTAAWDGRGASPMLVLHAVSEVDGRGLGSFLVGGLFTSPCAPGSSVTLVVGDRLAEDDDRRRALWAFSRMCAALPRDD